MADRAPAGTRDKYVTLQKIVAGSDKGLPIETAGTAYQMFAARNDLTGSRERMVGGQVAAGLETEWTLPYHPELDPETVDVAQAFRLVYGGRTHDIVFASLIGRKHGILITTTVRVG
jgi:hypothetical protein